MARLKYWVWLSCVNGVRPLMKHRLAEALGGPDKLYFAGREELGAFPGLRPMEAERLSDKSMSRAESVLSLCEEKGIGVLTIQDATYPERLRNISDPPVVLYVWGRLPAVDDALVLAVVGTRKASPYGIKMAMEFGRDITLGGGIVASGLAEGCDGAAMEGALAAGGTVIGVLGTAIDVVYPAKNRRLFQETRARGALVSEYPPGARTYPANFTARNRIISGLSAGVVVVEAPGRSGTRNTVMHALEQGRDVFAVPGNADAAASAGCNSLIAEGAIPATRGGDVLAEYEGRIGMVPLKSAPTPIKKEIDKPKDLVYIDLTEEQEKLPSAQRKILSVMTRPDMHADEIIEAAGLAASETLAALTMLQITGHVAQGAGKRYTRRF